MVAHFLYFLLPIVVVFDVGIVQYQQAERVQIINVVLQPQRLSHTSAGVCWAVKDSPVVASVGAVISQTLIRSTTTHTAPLTPICVYRSLILGDGKQEA